MPVNLTKRLIESLQSGPKDIFIWDSDPSGFGLKVTPSGGRIFVYQYRARRVGGAGTIPRRYTIGSFGKLTPDRARQKAKELAAIVALGGDPLEQRRVEREAEAEAIASAQELKRREDDLALDQVAQRWLDSYRVKVKKNGAPLRSASIAMAKMVVDNHLTPFFGQKSIAKISRADAKALCERVPAEQKATRRAVFAYSRILFRWAVENELCEINPFVGIEKPAAPQARAVTLDPSEIRKVWEATYNEPQILGTFWRLLFITGQRRSEIAGMRWGELSRADAVWTIPESRSKNGKSHLLPLSELAIAEIDGLAGGDVWPSEGYAVSTTGRGPISGFSKLKRRLDGNSGVTGWRGHDIRRTVATQFQKLGIRFEITEAVLNHIGVSKSGVAGVYQLHDWQDEKRIALDAWAMRLLEIVGLQERGDNVLPINRKAG